MLAARLATLTLLLSLFLVCGGAPAARAADDARPRVPFVAAQSGADWRAPLLRGLVDERRVWGSVMGSIGTLHATLGLVGFGTDPDSGGPCGADCFEDWRYNGAPSMIAVAVGTYAFAGVGSALGTLDIIERRIRTSRDPLRLAGEFAVHGRGFTTVGGVALGISLLLPLLSLTFPPTVLIYVPIALAHSAFAHAFFQAGGAWTRWAARVAGDDGRPPGPGYKHWRPQPLDYEGMPALLRVPLP